MPRRKTLLAPKGRIILGDMLLAPKCGSILGECRRWPLTWRQSRGPFERAARRDACLGPKKMHCGLTWAQPPYSPKSGCSHG